jgi:hypothetical protein
VNGASQAVGVGVPERRPAPARSSDVRFVRWPAESVRRTQLEQLRVPRLLLVSEGAEAPVSTDPLEDWIRLPAYREDVAVRIRQLRRRAAAYVAPTVDEHDILRIDGRWLALTSVEARLVHVLLAAVGEVVSREALLAAGWPDAPTPRRNALDLQILRLRRRIAPLRLTIQTVWGRGYMLELAGPHRRRRAAQP